MLEIGLAKGLALDFADNTVIAGLLCSYAESYNYLNCIVKWYS